MWSTVVIAAEPSALALARDLRAAGLTVELDGSGSAFGKQFKRADRSGAPLGLVLGDDEAERGEVRLKALQQQGEESTVALAAMPRSWRDCAPPEMQIHLVTGGAGFLGSHLIDRLMEAGDEVICLDNYFTGRKANIARWIGHPRFELIRHDVTEPIKLEVDRIWHLACPASPIHYQFNPVKTAKTSFLGTYNMLGLARRVGARLLLASTSEVYGDPEVHPQPESYRGCVNPIGIRSCYDEGKRIAETLCFDYQRMNGVEVRVARIFNTYGPRMLIR